MNPKHVSPKARRTVHFSFNEMRNGRPLDVTFCNNEPTYLIQSKTTPNWDEVNCVGCQSKRAIEDKGASRNSINRTRAS